MITYGFYNSVNHDRRYNAIEFGSIFDGIIGDGVFMSIGTWFQVTEAEDMMVLIGAGRAWFNHTWTLNDSSLPIHIPESEVLLDRIDAIVLDINGEQEVRQNDILVIKGTPSKTPQNPVLINEGNHHQYPLAFVLVKAGTTSIRASDITNMVGTSECPFVAGILKTVDLDDLLLQWEDQWTQFITKYENSTEKWFEEQKNEFSLLYEEFKNQMMEFEKEYGKEFTDWFSGLKDILDEDTAGHLLNLINKAIETEFNHYNGLVNSSTTINKSTKVIQTITSEGVSTTSFKKDENGNKTITTLLSMNSGNFDYVKTTTITDEDSEKQIKTSYVRQLK